MGLTIHEEPRPDRLVTMGQADTIIKPSRAEERETAAHPVDNLPARPPAFNDSVEKAMAAAVPIPDDPPPEQMKPNRGRPKKMAKDQDLSKAGTKTIREDDPGEKGAIGSHGENAPAQKKVPDSSQDKGEDKKNA